MASGKVSRRWVVGVLGAGALAMPLRAAAGASDANALASARSRRFDLVPGARLARWVIADVEPLHRGAVVVVLHAVDDERHRFRLEILARDPSPLAARPPAETQRFAVFVCNGGDGWSPTIEEQGLAAMTLAARIAKSDALGDAEGFLTHADRIALHPASLLSSG